MAWVLTFSGYNNPMCSNNSVIYRLTDSQQRFEVLWKKRMEGEPTLKELAEMDEIINRDPSIYQFVLKQMEDCALPPRDGEQKAPPTPSAIKKVKEKLISFFKLRGIFFLHGSRYPDNIFSL